MAFNNSDSGRFPWAKIALPTMMAASVLGVLWATKDRNDANTLVFNANDPAYMQPYPSPQTTQFDPITGQPIYVNSGQPPVTVVVHPNGAITSSSPPSSSPSPSTSGTSSLNGDDLDPTSEGFSPMSGQPPSTMPPSGSPSFPMEEPGSKTVRPEASSQAENQFPWPPAPGNLQSETNDQSNQNSNTNQGLEEELKSKSTVYTKPVSGNEPGNRKISTSSIMVPPGTKVGAEFRTQIVGQAGLPVEAYLVQAVPGYQKLPRGTKLVGKLTRVADRFQVQFTKAIDPAGQQFSIQATAHDSQGGEGVRYTIAKKDNSKIKLINQALLASAPLMTQNPNLVPAAQVGIAQLNASSAVPGSGLPQTYVKPGPIIVVF